MLFRGNRRLVVLAAAGVVIAVIAIVVVLNNRDEHVYDEPVASSTLDDFETRGPLADDKDVVEAAADVWRKGDSYRAETKPSREIELLWAGEVEADALKDLVTDKDTPRRVQVVILRSGREVATFAERQIDSDRAFDGIGIEEMSILSSPLVEVPGDLILTADSAPESYEAVDEDAIAVTVRADDGLISSTREGIALRLKSTMNPQLGRDTEPGIFLYGTALSVAPGDLDRVWSMLVSSYVTVPVREAIRQLLAAPTGRPGVALERPRIEIVQQSKAPGGRSLLVLSATGTGATAGSGGSARTAAAVDYTAERKDGPLVVASLGRMDDMGSWVGSAWMMTPEGARPYFVVAGGDGTETIQVYLGRQAERVAAPGGVVVPDKAVRQDELPAVVVAGFTKNGGVVPTMPEE